MSKPKKVRRWWILKYSDHWSIHGISYQFFDGINEAKEEYRMSGTHDKKELIEVREVPGSKASKYRGRK